MLEVFSTSPQDPPGSPALDLRPLSSVGWALTFSAGRTLCGSDLQSLVSWPVQIRVLSPGSASWSGPVVFSSQDVTETEAPQLFILAWKSSTRKNKQILPIKESWRPWRMLKIVFLRKLSLKLIKTCCMLLQPTGGAEAEYWLWTGFTNIKQIQMPTPTLHLHQCCYTCDK